MAYEKQTWEAGQVITAEKMNHMEDGILNNQGAKGDTGDPGQAATIDSVTVTVDSTTTSPSCTVTPGGTAQNRTFEFAFKGIKGSKGDKGDPGDKGNPGTNAPTITGCTINVNGTVISGQLTMSEGEPISITGTYTAGT